MNRTPTANNPKHTTQLLLCLSLFHMAVKPGPTEQGVEEDIWA